MTVVVHLTTVHDLSTDTRILRRECAALHEAGLDVRVVATEPPGPVISEVPITWLAPPTNRLGRLVGSAARAARAVRAHRPDVLHVHDPELLPLALLLTLGRTKLVYDVHEDMPNLIMTKEWIPIALRRVVAWVVRQVERLTARRASLIVTATEPIADRFPADRTVVVRNYPDVDLADTAALAAPTDGARAGGPVYVGSITEERGARTLAKAARLLHDATGERVRLVGPCKPDALREVLLADAGGAVDVDGPVPAADVPALLADARLGLVTLPAHVHYVESLPTKLFEYMAAGLPVVASDFPLWRRIVEGAGCGLLVDPDDPTAIAAAMAELLADPTGASAMGASGRAAVASTYRWAIEADALVGAYGAL